MDYESCVIELRVVASLIDPKISVRHALIWIDIMELIDRLQYVSDAERGEYLVASHADN